MYLIIITAFFVGLIVGIFTAAVFSARGHDDKDVRIKELRQMIRGGANV